MMREMTLGQFYQTDSILHRLDPRVKFIGTILYMISLFLPKSFLCLGIAAIVALLMILISRVPLHMYVRGIRPLLPLMIFTALVNIFFVKGNMILSWGIVEISKEGIWLAAYMLIRLFFLILGSAILTFTTSPNQLMDAIEKCFYPLTYAKIPVHEIAMTMSIALRFIPIMTEELNKIMRAQMSRGADFEEGNIMERARKLIPVIVPLLISAIRRATDLALAMDARCYHGGAGRTKLHPLRYKRRDYLAYVLILLYLIGMILLSIFV